MSERRFQVLIATFAMAWLIPCNSTRAQVFLNESAFLAALPGGHISHNFDTLPHNKSISTEYAGFDFGGTARTWDAIIFGAGGTAYSPPNVLFNYGTAPISFTLTTPAIGIGFYNTSFGDKEELVLRDTNGQIIFTGQLPIGPINYLGFKSAVPIGSGQVYGVTPTNGTIFIDSITLGLASNPTAWIDEGFSLAGTYGPPRLSGVGTLVAGTPATIFLSSAAPLEPALLFVSLSSNPLPFKGGVLVAVPPLLNFALYTSSTGNVVIPVSSWPTGLSGTSLHLQVAIHDVMAIQDVALSNALRISTP